MTFAAGCFNKKDALLSQLLSLTLKVTEFLPENEAELPVLGGVEVAKQEKMF